MVKMKNLITLIILCAAISSSAQTTGYRNSYKHYEATGNQKSVALDAYFSGTEVSGLIYQGSKDCIPVNGQVHNGEMILVGNKFDLSGDTTDNNYMCMCFGVKTMLSLKEDYSQSMQFNEVFAELNDSLPYVAEDDENAMARNSIVYSYMQPVSYKGVAVSDSVKNIFAKMFNAAPRQSVEGDFFYPEPFPTMKLKADLLTSKNRFRRYADSVIQNESRLSSLELTMQESNFQYITYNRNGLVCIINNCYSYAGGAHGMYARVPVIFDAEQNKILTKKDIFKPGTDEAIIKLIIKYFIAHGDADDKPSDESEGIYKDDVFVENNIGIQNGNLVFYYQPYDINSYVAGAYSAVVKISDLLPYITDNSPIKRMLK